VNFWGEFQDWIAHLLVRPSLAVGYAVILLLAGVAAGSWQARVGAQRASETLGSRYVQMLDPYQMPRR
jgi:hypothetical protein